MTKRLHAGDGIKCNDGVYRASETLCGLSVNWSGQQGVTRVPDDVTCKACRRSQAWAGYIERSPQLYSCPKCYKPTTDKNAECATCKEPTQ